METQNSETEKERILDELHSERTIWLGAVSLSERQEAYERLDDLLLQFNDHLKHHVEVHGEVDVAA